MLIDFHTHIYPDKIALRTVESLGGKAHIPYFTDGTLSGLERLMAEAGVDRYVLLHIATTPKHQKNVNAFALETNTHTHPAFGSVHPNSENWRETLAMLKDAGIKGVKFHNEYQNFFADDDRAMQVYEECVRQGLIMLFHGGADLAFSPPEKCSPARLARAASQLPGGIFVFAHLGGMRSTAESIRYLAPLKNVYTDTAFSSQYLTLCEGREVIEAFGADRILFGTDCPWDTPARTLEYIGAMGLSSSALEKICCRNALRLLGE